MRFEPILLQWRHFFVRIVSEIPWAVAFGATGWVVTAAILLGSYLRRRSIALRKEKRDRLIDAVREARMGQVIGGKIPLGKVR